MPTDAQKEAGNYPKYHIRVAGLPISIENRKGSLRSGKSAGGVAWSVRMPCDYGYFKRTLGNDGDQVDVFVGPHKESEFVCIVNQYPQIGNALDEHKVMLGFRNLREARAAYRASYNFRPNAEFKATTVQRLKEWLGSGHARRGAFRFDSRINLIRLTGLAPNVKPTEFRQPEKPKEEQRSRAARIARYAAPVAAVAATYGLWHKFKRPQVPTPPKRPPNYSNPNGYSQPVGPVPPVVKTAAATPPAPKKKTPVIASLAKRKLVQNKQLSAKARVILLNYSHEEYNHRKGASDSVFASYRKVRRAVPTIMRTGEVAEDVADVASGKKPKNPFWKKSWFKKAALATAIAAPVAYSRKVNAWHHQDRAFPGSVTGVRKKVLDNANARFRQSKPFFAAKTNVTELDQTKAKALPTSQAQRDAVMRKLLGKMSQFNRKPENFVPRPGKRPTCFDLDAGWDLRDARGRSARVYAPGSRKRQRREKTPLERVDNIRLVRNAALVGTAAGAAGIGYAVHKGKVTGRQVKQQYRKVLARVPRKATVTAFPNLKAMSANVREKLFRSTLHRVIESAADNVSISRPEVPGEGVAKIVIQNKPARSALLRILGAGTVAGAGVLGGLHTKRPKTGAILGGLGAGLILK